MKDKQREGKTDWKERLFVCEKREKNRDQEEKKEIEYFSGTILQGCLS